MMSKKRISKTMNNNMKVVIFAGGLGTRLAEETEIKPKPMVEIGGYPILLHIMRYYAQYGFKEFVIALGYKNEMVKRYFMDYYSLNGTMTICLKDGRIDHLHKEIEDWIIHCVDTGLNTMTGGRLKRLEPFLKDQRFMLTYGDGVCNIDLNKLLRFHKTHGRIATITAVHPPARFGELIFDGDFVTQFSEKPQLGEGWINGGFMVFEPQVFKYLEGDETVLERDILPRLATEGHLAAYQHTGFWQCMDTLRDVRTLENLWQSNNAPWKVYEK